MNTNNQIISFSNFITTLTKIANDEIISWFTIDKQCKYIRLRYKCNKLIRKLRKIKREKKISQKKVIELVDEIEQLTKKYTKLETENQELRDKLKIRSFKSQKAFVLTPTYIRLS